MRVLTIAWTLLLIPFLLAQGDAPKLATSMANSHLSDKPLARNRTSSASAARPRVPWRVLYYARTSATAVKSSLPRCFP